MMPCRPGVSSSICIFLRLQRHRRQLVAVRLVIEGHSLPQLLRSEKRKRLQAHEGAPSVGHRVLVVGHRALVVSHRALTAIETISANRLPSLKPAPPSPHRWTHGPGRLCGEGGAFSWVGDSTRKDGSPTMRMKSAMGRSEERRAFSASLAVSWKMSMGSRPPEHGIFTAPWFLSERPLGSGSSLGFSSAVKVRRDKSESCPFSRGGEKILRREAEARFSVLGSRFRPTAELPNDLKG
eukprot:scaffold1954_cov268-Pinguiococcus_pyrenoidosus.AAC.15